jgi:co-chaperonin GroES (HSP10)
MNVIHENVLIEVQESEKSKNGVILPEEMQKDQRIGTVVRFGGNVPSYEKALFGAKPKVKYKEYFDGEKLVIEDKTYIVMNFKDILIIY